MKQLQIIKFLISLVNSSTLPFIIIFTKYKSINIGTLTILIFLTLYTTTMDLKLNEQDVLYVQTFSFNLRVFTSKSGERCRNYNSFYMCLPLKGPKVMGQTNNHKSKLSLLKTWLQILCNQLQPEVWNA